MQVISSVPGPKFPDVRLLAILIPSIRFPKGHHQRIRQTSVPFSYKRSHSMPDLPPQGSPDCFERLLQMNIFLGCGGESRHGNCRISLRETSRANVVGVGRPHSAFRTRLYSELFVILAHIPRRLLYMYHTIEEYRDWRAGQVHQYRNPARLAQSVERETLNLKVAGSTPASGSIPRCIRVNSDIDLSFCQFVAFVPFLSIVIFAPLNSLE